MGQFSYKAVNQGGEHITGMIEAVDRRSAVGNLVDKGQFVTELAEETKAASVSVTTADSMIAVLVRASHHHLARHGRWAASTVLARWTFAPSNAPVTSPNPSPPSLMGKRSSESPARARCQPRAMACAAAAAVRVPLNLSGMIRTCSGMGKSKF